MAASVYIPIHSVLSALFSTSLPTLVVYCLSDNGQSDKREVISHCSFFNGFFKQIAFNWRIIALGYCAGFCHEPMNEPLAYTCPPQTLNLPSNPQPIPGL